MDTKTLDLRGCSDDKRDSAITRALAIIAGYSVACRPTAKDDLFPWYLTNAAGVKTGGWRTEDSAWSHGIPPYATSADAVLPLLEKWVERDFNYRHADTRVRKNFCYVDLRGALDGPHYAEAKTFPLAACLALLRAKGIEVLT